LQNGTNLSQKSRSLNQSHYEVWALITLKEVGWGIEKIPTMPPCHMKKHYGTQLYQNGPHLCITNTFASMKIETPLTLKLGMWDGPRPFFHILKNHLIKKIYQL
jgi:hypothetical protein